MADVKPEDTVRSLFDAMRAHDGELLLAQFAPGARLQRVDAEGEVSTTPLEKFADAIAGSTRDLDERLISVDGFESDTLASLWTPYVFYLDGEISHCGVNSFQLVRVAGVWKIQSLIDTVHPGDCGDFARVHAD